ncbi:hypothetical protein CIK05_15095 [Bdellovibrio sp. qaytius]|nr:hypothetical protein CIK05_15095 [Bdellovibrio sp. qaytius]
MLKALFTVFILGSIFSTSAMAAGDAGCGLGGLIITKNSKLLQLFAATTNGSTGTQTLGITFGTSGCSANGLVQNDKQIQYFVEVNQAELTREMAQGHGEKLSTLAALNGCASEGQISSFNTKAQSNFGMIVPSAKTSAVDFVNNMKSASVADACHGS